MSNHDPRNPRKPGHNQTLCHNPGHRIMLAMLYGGSQAQTDSFAASVMDTYRMHCLICCMERQPWETIVAMSACFNSIPGIQNTTP